MDWVLSVLVILVNILVGRKNKWGWVLSMIVSILWVYYALTLTPRQFGLIPSSVILFFVATINAYKWFKDDRSNTP